jgi:phage tail-like protein
VSREDANNFYYLNREGRWPDFQWKGLELRHDGALQLHTLPCLDGELPTELSTVQTPDGPAGIAVGIDGTIYFSDPAAQRVLRIDGCDGELTVVPCIGGEGSAPTQFHTPRGLLILKHRRSLFVADSGNHRIQIFDPASCQLLEMWGWTDAGGKPMPSAEPGRLDTPWTMTDDDEGNIYVVDYGNERVQKFNRVGEVVPFFWDNLQSVGLRHPVDIAQATAGNTTTLYVIAQDATAKWKVFVCDTAGRAVVDAMGHPVTFGADQMHEPMGIAAGAGAVYVGDNNRRRVLVFKQDDLKPDGSFLHAGEAVGYEGPVGALALGSHGDLLVHTGTALKPVRLAVNRGHSGRGVMWSQAIKVRDHEVQWHRLHAVMEKLADGTHLRLFVHTADDSADAPLVNPAESDPFTDQKWRPRLGSPDQISDVTDLFIGGKTGKLLWIGMLFSGDGRNTPVVSQLRLEFDHETYLNHMPAIYRGQTPCGDFLKRFLALFESLLGETEGSINQLSRLFDPAGARPEFLPWLAGWFALDLDEDWDEAQRRRLIAAAFERYSRRGTAIGLRESLRLFAGVEAIVEEPILQAAWWSLPAEQGSCKSDGKKSNEKLWDATENSILGFTTMLAPAHPQGAVLGSTATLDQSHLITNEQFGAPLFEDVAHQFSVQVYRGQLKCPETLSEVHAVIQREKPAHTDYHLCVIEPRMRVGFQARVGIDAVVSGPPEAMRLGEVDAAGKGIVLGGEPAGRVGVESRVGIATRVG